MDDAVEAAQGCNASAVRERGKVLAPHAHEAGSATLHRVKASELGGRVAHPNGAAVLHGGADVGFVQESNGPFAQYVSCTSKDAESLLTFFVDVSYMLGPGEVPLKGQPNNLERGTFGEGQVAKGKRRVRAG